MILKKTKMASPFTGICKVIVHLILLPSFLFYLVNSTEFLVGGDTGWVAPKSRKDDQMYNNWASKNRFKVDDTARFKYKKDSVLVVTEEEYKKCQSAHPSFFSNNGDTVFKLDRPGLFYFISGVTGHCEKGLKMIIKVLEPEIPPQSGNETSTTNEPKKKSGAAETAAITSTIIILLSVSLLVLLFV